MTTQSLAAYIAYTVTLSKEVAPFGIRVVLAVPGGFQTPNVINGPNVTTKHIPSYDTMREWAEEVIKQSWVKFKGAGDPAKAMDMLVDVLKGEGRAKGRSAPLWLVLGQGTFDRGREYCKNLTDTMDAWEDITKDLDVEVYN